LREVLRSVVLGPVTVAGPAASLSGLPIDLET
jgi:hypothetical protein